MGLTPYTVYILECSDLSYYTGIARDVDTRLRVHEQGRGSKYVAKRLPADIVFKSEVFKNRSIAQRVEHAIKKLNRSDKERLVDSLFNRHIYQSSVLDTFSLVENGRQVLKDMGNISTIVSGI